jgi:hypothetical protein
VVAPFGSIMLLFFASNLVNVFELWHMPTPNHRLNVTISRRELKDGGPNEVLVLGPHRRLEQET